MNRHEKALEILHAGDTVKYEKKNKISKGLLTK